MVNKSSLVKRRLGKSKHLLIDLFTHVKEFFAAAQYWQYALSAIVLFGAYAF